MFKKVGIISGLAVLLTAAATAVPSLATQPGATNQPVLQLGYDSVCARAGFTTGAMTDIVSLMPRASDLNEHVDRLNADLTMLNGYVAAGDPDGFGSYVSSTINPDMQAAHKAMAEAWSHYREWNLTLQTRQELRTMLDARKATYDGQIQALTIRLGDIRLTGYNDAVAEYGARMEKLIARGVDVSGMQAVEAGAQANVIEPLRAAVASGDAVQVRAELKDKSLGNGAPYSYHFWAKMDMAGGKAISARIADNATQAGYGEQLAEADAELAAARSTLDTVGTGPYTVEQQSTIWSNLNSAAGQICNIIKALYGH